MKVLTFLFFLFCSTLAALEQPKVQVGIDNLFTKEHKALLKGKKIGLIANQTSVNSKLKSTRKVLEDNAVKYSYTLSALFAPEHGFQGSSYAGETVEDLMDSKNIPIYSLHGKHRRPSEEMLKNVNLLIFDIQDIGSRSYTYINTLFYVMEEAAKQKIPMIVLDRPNPINGLTIDGPLLDEKLRSFVGYVNVPYCHGMTVGELARLFNTEYKINCQLHVVPMKGWKRRMSYSETGLVWIPPSPNIPEATTAWFYPITGIIGELGIVNIGIGYTLPFKVLGAPWINGEKFSKALNDQKFPGVHFEPYHYRPFYGKFANEDCHGILILITNPAEYLPVTTQYMIIGMLKGLYPKHFRKSLEQSKSNKAMFDKVNGTNEIYKIMTEKPHIVWPLREFQLKEREEFKELRKKYLDPAY